MVTDLTVVFSHGKESGPWGSKIRSMASCCELAGARIVSIDYQGIASAAERTAKLDAYLQSVRGKVLLVGSSMGGYVSAAAGSTSSVIGLFLLAPAFYLRGYPDIACPGCPIEIVHGWRDEVVPVDNSIRFARNALATLHLVDGDHRLMGNLGEINELLVSFLRRVSLS